MSYELQVLPSLFAPVICNNAGDILRKNTDKQISVLGCAIPKSAVHLANEIISIGKWTLKGGLDKAILKVSVMLVQANIVVLVNNYTFTSEPWEYNICS